MAKVPPKSVYRSPKSVAKNQTVPISVDDPRLAWDKRGQTYARQGADIEEVSLDGTPVIEGGKSLRASVVPVGTGVAGVQQTRTVTGTNNRPAREVDYDLITPSAVTNVVATWSGDNLVVNFDWDYDDPLNFTVSEFIVELTGDGVTLETSLKQFPVNRTQTQQTLTITPAINESVFGGNFVVNLTSVCIIAMDAFYNRSEKTCDVTIPPYVLNLPIPVITVTAITNGYSVAYTKPTQSIYDAIEISEYESNDATEPTGVTYNVRSWDIVSPANITVENTNPRWVKARFSSNAKIFTAYSAAQKVTPLSPITVDTTGPSAPTGTVTGGIETSGTIGFNAFLNISWTAVSDATLRGYRIRFRPVTTPASNYSYVDSPGTGTAFRITGLASGTNYEVGIAAYDEFNNTSSAYQTLTGSPVSTAGSPFIGTNVATTGHFQAGVAGTDTGVFKFGYGVQDSGGALRGLVFNANNYWYIDSNQSASLKVGGGPSNYISWNGSTFAVDGDITARSGTFSGNILMSTANASIYNGTINSGGELSGNGFALNSKGLKVANGTNSVTIDAATGSILANAGTIAGWTISADKITKTVGGQGKIDINSSEGYIAVASTTEVDKLGGINAAKNVSESVFWVGGTNPNSEANAFRVNLAGQLFATSAELEGTVRAKAGGFGTFNSTTKAVTAGWEISADGITAKGLGQIKVATGRIQVGNYSIKSLNSTEFQVYDDSSNTTILSTDTVSGAGVSDPKRIFLGDNTRQVEVAKSASFTGDPTTATLPSSNSTVLSSYRSGGLRNMFTTSLSRFQDIQGSNTNVLLYPSAIKGDVLIVYNNNGIGGDWRTIHSMYINISGVPLETTAPPTTTTTTSAPGTTTTTTTTTAAPTTYSVTYNCDGGTGCPANTTHNGSYIIPSSSPTKSGFTFSNWFVTCNGTFIGGYSTGSSLSCSGNLVITAQWTAAATTTTTTTAAPTTTTTTAAPTTYSVTYNCDGGTGCPANTTHTGSYTIPSGTPTKSGSTFSSYYVYFNGTTFIGGYSPGSSVNASGNLTIVAQWSVNTTAAPTTAAPVTTTTTTAPATTTAAPLKRCTSLDVQDGCFSTSVCSNDGCSNGSSCPTKNGNACD